MVFKQPESYLDVDSSALRGKTIFITGATSGIGREAALAFGRLGATVYIHGRDKKRGKDVKDTLQKVIGVDAEFFRGDFSKFNEVRAVAEMVKDETDSIDILIHNAGGYFRGNQTASDGLEYTFSVNHLGSAILTVELLPLLQSGNNNGKIITTASEAHRAAEFDLAVTQTPSNGWKSYCRSKLMNIMFTKALARRLVDEQITVASLHPGVIPGGGFMRHLPGPMEKVGNIADYVPLPGIKSTKEGASTIVYAATSDSVSEHSGVYLVGNKPKRPAEAAQDIEAQDALWDYSLNATNTDTPEDLKYFDVNAESHSE